MRSAKLRSDKACRRQCVGRARCNTCGAASRRLSRSGGEVCTARDLVRANHDGACSNGSMRFAVNEVDGRRALLAAGVDRPHRTRVELGQLAHACKLVWGLIAARIDHAPRCLNIALDRGLLLAVIAAAHIRRREHACDGFHRSTSRHRLASRRSPIHSCNIQPGRSGTSWRKKSKAPRSAPISESMTGTRNTAYTTIRNVKSRFLTESDRSKTKNCGVKRERNPSAMSVSSKPITIGATIRTDIFMIRSSTRSSGAIEFVPKTGAKLVAGHNA